MGSLRQSTGRLTEGRRIGKQNRQRTSSRSIKEALCLSSWVRKLKSPTTDPRRLTWQLNGWKHATAAFQSTNWAETERSALLKRRKQFCLGWSQYTAIWRQLRLINSWVVVIDLSALKQRKHRSLVLNDRKCWDRRFITLRRITCLKNLVERSRRAVCLNGAIKLWRTNTWANSRIDGCVSRVLRIRFLHWRKRRRWTTKRVHMLDRRLYEAFHRLSNLQKASGNTWWATVQVSLRRLW